MRNTSISLLREIHKLNTDSSIVCLLKIVDPTTTLYLARNNQNITWAGITWSAFWFEIEALTENTSGEIPELTITTSNIGMIYDSSDSTYKSVENYVIEHDNFEDSTCTIYLINSDNLTDDDGVAISIFEMTYDVVKPIVTRLTVSLKIAAENPLLLIYPAWHFHGSICQYRKFGKDMTNDWGHLCGHGISGTETCDRTLTACISFGNQKRIGAQLSLEGETQDV